MKTQAFLAASAIALGLLSHPILSQAADGQQCGHAGFGQERHGWGQLAKRLQLSKEQRQSMNAIEDKYHPKLRDLGQSLGDNRAALKKMDANDPKLADTAAAQGKAIADLIVMRKQMHAEMRQVLTEAQRQTLDTLREQRHHHEMPHG